MARQKRITITRNINTMEQEQCETSEGLFHTLNSKFKP